jgi:DNA-binding NtrC family response regulator
MKREILLIEDDASVRELVVAVLKSDTHEVMTAASVEDARKIIGAGPEARALCLIIDVVLRHESGLAFAQELVEQHPAFRVLLISGYAEDVQPTASENAGRMAFLPKPFSRQDLLAAVEKVCA